MIKYNTVQKVIIKIISLYTIGGIILEYSTKKLAQNKLIILYLLQKMGISLSHSEISQFLLSKDYMDYFSLQDYLTELVEASWLEKTQEHKNTRYLLTDDGNDVINFFKNHITDPIKEEIKLYVKENNKRIRAEYAITANYFPIFNDEFLVKCGVCDDNENSLMEISVAVVSKEQAQQMCKNWRKNINTLYGTLMNTLLSSDTDKK